MTHKARILLAKFPDQTDYVPDKNTFQDLLLPLYERVLSEADLLVVTPFVASRNVVWESFPADLVLLDECTRTRELSSLIALAHYNPAAYVFLGDHRQTGLPGGGVQRLRGGVQHRRPATLQQIPQPKPARGGLADQGGAADTEMPQPRPRRVRRFGLIATQLPGQPGMRDPPLRTQ